MHARHPDRRGLTLIELLVVVSILAILSMSLVPTAEIVTVRLLETDLQNNLRLLRRSIQNWHDDCEKAIERDLRAAGVGNVRATLLAIPDCFFYPPSIGSLTTTTPYTVYDAAGNYMGTFNPRAYLKFIPNNPFIQAPIWTQHYASATPVTTTSTYTLGLIDPANVQTIASGVFDVSVPPATATMRGFVQALDGTYYRDW
ncbi:MAG: type II secretion system protein [Candidatus Riflebacteria bacterium]|nr:type II secretion system protein [Candidatus Riflebacteria bacterium]